MSKRKIDLRASLRDVADRYVEDNPADFVALREGVMRRRGRRLVARFASVTAVAALGVAGLYLVAGQRDGGTALPPAAPGESAIETSVSLPGNLYQVAGAGDIAFVTTNRGAISRVDAGMDEAVWTQDIGGFPADVVVVGDGLWVSDRANNRIVHLNVRSGEILDDSIQLEEGQAPTRMNVGASAIRAVIRDEAVMRFDRTTGEQRELYRGAVLDTAMGNEAFWVLTADGTALAIDPDTGAAVADVAPVTDLGDGEITFARGAVWYGSPGSSELVRIDESDGSTVRADLPGSYLDLDGGNSGLWVLVDAAGDGGQVIELDPSDGGFIGTRFDLDGAPADLSSGGVGLWVVQREVGRVVYLVP